MLPGLSFDNSISRWLPQDSESFKEYKSFLDDFSSDALLILTLKGNDPEIPEEELQNHLNKIEKSEGVISISKWPPSIVRYKNKIASGNTSYIIRFEPQSYLNPNRPELIHFIHEIFSETGWDYYLGGTGVIHEAINQQTRASTSGFMVTGFLILLSLLLIILRSFTAILQTLMVAFGGVAFMVYVAAILHIPIGIAHTIIPVIIFFYSTSLSLHILAHSGDFRKVIVPSLWVILTTSLGFIAFLFSSTTLLKDFALLGIAGLAGVFISALCMFYPKVNSYRPRALFNVTNKLGLTPFRFILPVLTAVLLICIPGLMKLKAEIHSLSVLSENSKAYKDHQFIESNVGPYFPLEYVVNTSALRPADIGKWINNVYSLEEIGAVISYRQLPPFVNKMEWGYQSKTDPDLFRISFLVPLMSTLEGFDLIQRINRISDTIFSNAKPQITGFMTLYARVADDLLNSFKQSLVWAVVLISLVFFLFLRNWKAALIAIVVNILPVIIILGFMGWMNIRLDMVTIPIGCLLLSIVVDDTIHFLYWYKKKYDWKMALENAGSGILITSVVLTGGFFVLLFSEAPPVRYFGFLSIIAVISALLLDLFVLPSLLNKFLSNESRNN